MTRKITHFGTKTALSSRTPSWANNAVAVTIIVTGIAHFIIKQDNSIAASLADRICLYLDGAEMLVVALSRLFGVTHEPFDNQKPQL